MGVWLAYYSELGVRSSTVKPALITMGREKVSLGRLGPGSKVALIIERWSLF